MQEINSDFFGSEFLKLLTAKQKWLLVITILVFFIFEVNLCKLSFFQKMYLVYLYILNIFPIFPIDKICFFFFTVLSLKLTESEHKSYTI